MSQDALSLILGSEAVRPAQGRTEARGLVFVGLWVRWGRQIGDLDFNTRLAQEWERVFDHWSIEGRRIHLGHGGVGYTLDLKDGSAKFVVQVPRIALSVVQQHARQLLVALRESGRSDITVYTEAQYLEPVQGIEFETLMHSMIRKLLKPEFIQHVGAEIADLAYMVDLEAEGQWFQVKAGPVRAHEIPQRVESTPSKLGRIPELAVFYSLASRADVDGPEFDLDVFWQRVSKLGDSIAKELIDDQPRAQLES